MATAAGCVPMFTGDHVEETLFAHVETTPPELKTLDARKVGAIEPFTLRVLAAGQHASA